MLSSLWKRADLGRATAETRAHISRKCWFLARTPVTHIHTEDRPAQRTPLLTQEICIPWVLTLRAAPPHSNDTVGLPKRDFRSPAAIQDPMPAARSPAPAAHECFVPETAVFERFGSSLSSKSPFAWNLYSEIENRERRLIRGSLKRYATISTRRPPSWSKRADLGPGTAKTRARKSRKC